MDKSKDETVSLNLSFFKRLPKHNWAITSYILAILVIILLLSNFSPLSITGNVISEKNVKPMIEEFINTQLIPGGGATISSVREESGIYIAIVTIQGQSVPTYFTKDGKFIAQGTGLIKIDEPLPLLPTENNNIETLEDGN